MLLKVGNDQTTGAPPSKKKRKPKGFYKVNTIRVTIRTKIASFMQNEDRGGAQGGRKRAMGVGGRQVKGGKTPLNELCFVDLTSELYKYFT